MNALGWAAVEAGIRDEDRVVVALRARGWGVTPFGQRAWDPNTCAWGDSAVIAAVRRVPLALRHAPDLLAGRPETGICLVEVIDGKGRDQRCMEIAKLRAFDDWHRIAPLAVVDAHGDDWWAWWHSTAWPYACRSDVTRRTFTGSGDPYAWFDRQADRRFDHLFGPPLETPTREDT